MAGTHQLSTASLKPLPKQQRRGAINILGMLALARRTIVQDKVDKLLKIGLGQLGKVSTHRMSRGFEPCSDSQLGVDGSRPSAIHLHCSAATQRQREKGKGLVDR